MLFSKNSQLILRHHKIFKSKNVFFLGNIDDDCPMYLLTNKTKVNFQIYNYYIKYQKKNIKKNIDIYNNFIISEHMIHDCDTVIYYWPKNKLEAQFQLLNIMSCCLIGTQIFIVGNNCSGVKSALVMFKEFIDLKKIDNAKHAILMSGHLQRNPKFIIEDFLRVHIWKKFSIISLPGIFGYKKIDKGSELLVSTFSHNITGNVLDIGSGTGFLSVCLLYYSPKIEITLVDNNSIAIKCSRETLKINELKGEVILSDLYSNVYRKFNLIISNPAFHQDLKLNFKIIKKIILYSEQYLVKNGELRLVTNSCFNYHYLFKTTFKKYSIIKKNKTYQVFQAFLN